jgi:hypothetical protein
VGFWGVLTCGWRAGFSGVNERPLPSAAAMEVGTPLRPASGRREPPRDVRT